MSDRELADHRRWDELAAGHALHALEPAEAAEFDAHLAHCARCRQSVDEMSFVAAQLGSLATSGADEAPPWRRMRPGVVGSAGVAPAQRRTGRRWALPAATAAVALAAVAVLGVRLAGSGGSPTLTAAACARDAACRHVVLRTDDGRDAVTVLVRSRTASIASVALGAPPPGMQWVLWQVPRGGGPAFVQSFRAASARSASLPAGYDDTASFALSEEPSGPRPTQPTHIVASAPVG